jgi:hypothetical protein
MEILSPGVSKSRHGLDRTSAVPPVPSGLHIVAASTGATNKSFDEAAEGCFMLGLGALVILAIIYGVFNAILSLF